MSHWLIKSEPSVFSFAELATSPGRRTAWDGVRNYQARNFIRDRMTPGDLAFFYHSSCEDPAIIGIVKVVSAAYPDPTQFDRSDPHYDAASDPDDPRWFVVDVRYERRLSRPITLRELKQFQDDELDELALLRRGNRLSVMPVTEDAWKFIVGLEQRQPRA